MSGGLDDGYSDGATQSICEHIHSAQREGNFVIAEKNESKRHELAGRSTMSAGGLYHMMAASMLADMPYYLSSRMRRDIIDSIVPRAKKMKTCLLPGCNKQTEHRGGYCCREHCLEHRKHQRKRK